VDDEFRWQGESGGGHGFPCFDWREFIADGLQARGTCDPKDRPADAAARQQFAVRGVHDGVGAYFCYILAEIVNGISRLLSLKAG
jgi:hypothetical protein